MGKRCTTLDKDLYDTKIHYGILHQYLVFWKNKQTKNNEKQNRIKPHPCTNLNYVLKSGLSKTVRILNSNTKMWLRLKKTKSCQQQQQKKPINHPYLISFHNKSSSTKHF